jgi:tetratricopeptide (TPR) repeat protein
MALEEIERLKDKIEKDPSSKLFVPLAEEYKKAGMYDEAIDVLAKGLEKQPAYLSARVSLAKIYVERGLPDKARDEFEKVIEAIPDNLYAHKKLAEIYKELGEKDSAVREFKMVLRLNPADEWAATTLAEIEEKPGKPVPKPAEEKIPETPHLEERAPEETEREKPSGGESISEEDMKLWKAHTGKVEETEVTEEEAAAEAVELPEENSFSFEDIFKKPQAAVEEAEEIAEEVSEQPQLTAADADRYISQEKYSDAMKVYRDLLSIEPDNRQILQRVQELRALLKMLGKDKEQLISRLDSFLSGVKKRRNEFFGST